MRDWVASHLTNKFPGDQKMRFYVCYIKCYLPDIYVRLI
jgi:hypothetical protein